MITIPSSAPLPPYPVASGPAPGRPPERRAYPAGSGVPRPVLPRPALRAIAAGLAQTAPHGDHVWTEGERRRYSQLLATDLYDAWIIAWSPCSGVDLHDHGGSQGAVAVASGRLLESYTDLRWRHPIRSRFVDSTAVLTIPGIRVHEVSNPGPGDALSVHVYSPPLTTMTYFDPRPDTFLFPLSSTEGNLATLEEPRP